MKSAREACLVPAVIDELDHRKPNRHLAAPIIVHEVIRPPTRLKVAQNRQAHDRAMVQVINPVAVHEHSLCKSSVALALHLDVNQQPGFLAVFAPDFEKLVGSTDRAEIAERMAALLAAEPSFTDYHRQSLAIVSATLKPGHARPGTIEAMVDGLINVSNIDADSRPPDPLVSMVGAIRR